MKAIRDFIVHIPEKFSETFKTESGLELYASKDFSKKRLANTIVDVVETPFDYDGPIKEGCRLFIDPTIMMESSYILTGNQENQYLVDREKKLFRIPQSLVICYSMGEGTIWNLFGDNVLLTKIKTNEEPTWKSSIIMAPEPSKPKFEKGKGKVFLEIPELGLQENDVVLYKEIGAIDIWLRDMELIWMKQRYLLGVELKEAV